MVGGGDVALEDAIFLARLCERVYVIHRRDEFRGAKSLQKRLMELPNVEILWDTVPEEICGAEKVETLELFNKKTGEKIDLVVDGVFVAVGITPNSEEFKGSVDMDPAGYIEAGEDGKTNVPGNLRGRRRPYKGAPPGRYGSGRRGKLRCVCRTVPVRYRVGIS